MIQSRSSLDAKTFQDVSVPGNALTLRRNQFVEVFELRCFSLSEQNLSGKIVSLCRLYGRFMTDTLLTRTLIVEAPIQAVVVSTFTTQFLFCSMYINTVQDKLPIPVISYGLQMMFKNCFIFSPHHVPKSEVYACWIVQVWNHFIATELCCTL